MTRSTRKKAVIASVSAVAVLGIAAALILPGQMKKSRPPEVKTTTAVRGDVEQWLSSTGTIRSGNIKTYAPSTGVALKEVFVEVGDRVAAGQQLAVLETSTVESAVEQAKSAYESAGESLKQMKAAKAEADGQMAALEAEIQELESEIAGLQNSSDAAQKEMQALYEQLLAQLQQGEGGSVEELSALLKAQSETSGSLTSRQVELIGKQLQKSLLESQSSQLSDAALKQLESSMEMAKSTYESAKENLDTLKKGLVADFAGIVSEVGTSSSLMSSAGITVKDDTAVYAEITLGKYDIARVQAGQKAKISVPSADFEGEVESVGAIAQISTSLTGGTTSTVTARVRIDAPDGSLLIDYECDVDVRLGSASGVVLVPVESVRTDNTGSYCYVVENGALRRTAVKTGVSSESRIEVVSGLEEGAVLAANPSGDLTDGMAVRPIAE